MTHAEALRIVHDSLVAAHRRNMLVHAADLVLVAELIARRLNDARATLPAPKRAETRPLPDLMPPEIRKLESLADIPTRKQSRPKLPKP